MIPTRWIVRQWQQRPGRALAAAAAVALAVAAVVATWAAAAASRTAYRAMVTRIAGLPAVDVVARAGGRFDYAAVPRLADRPGVRAVVPQFFRPTVIRVGETRLREGVLGVDVSGLAALGLLELVSGQPCIGGRELVLDAGLAAGLGVGVGDEVILLFRRGPRRVRVVGLAAPASLASFSQGGGAAMDIASLADLSGADGHVDRVRVILRDDTDEAAVRAAVAGALPAALEARAPAGRESLAADVIRTAELGLDFITWLTVAMSWFIVTNAMLMRVSERRRSLALARTLGATRGQIRGMVIGEAAFLGVVGAAVGGILGILAAAPIARRLAAALELDLSGVSIDLRVLGAACLLGPLVAVVAAWWPARQAGAVDLLENLGHAPPDEPRALRSTTIVSVFATWLLAAALLAGVMVHMLPPQAAVAGGVVMLLAYVAILPVFLPGLIRMVSTWVPSRWRIETTLAREHLLRHPFRTALTTAVLVVAVSNSIGIGHAILDNVDDYLAWYGRAVRADWVLMPAGSEATAVDVRSIVDSVQAVDGVARVEVTAVIPTQVGGGPGVVIARDMPDDLPLPVRGIDVGEEMLRSKLAAGEVAIGTALAQRAGVAPGDTIRVELFGRTFTPRVAGLVADYTSGGFSVIARRDAARALFGLERVDYVMVSAAAGRSGDLAAPLARLASEQSLVARSFRETRQVIDRLLGGIVGALWAILVLGFAVGGLGIANTVAMNVAEQHRSLALLRAVGMTSGQVTRYVVLESMVLGTAGCVAGLLGGLVTAAFIQAASQPLLGHPVAPSLRVPIIGTTLAAALVVTTLAAALPTRRAARLDILESLSSD